MKLPIPFGNPATYEGHSGIDFPVPRGSVIRASGPGTVVTRAKNSAGGYYVFVRYDAIPAFPVGYHHMDSHLGVPAVSTRVQEGTRLGFVGSLGARSTGPHLHSEVSGHRTTDGYWQFFDRTRVVGAPAASASTPAPPTQSEEDEMELKPLIFKIDPAAKIGTVVADMEKQTFFRVRNSTQETFYKATGRAEPIHGAQPAAVIEGFKESNPA